MPAPDAPRPGRPDPRPRGARRAAARTSAPAPSPRSAPVEGEGLVARLEQHHLDLRRAARPCCTATAPTSRRSPSLVRTAWSTSSSRPRSSRPVALRALDRRREVDPGWFQRARMVGYVAYADRFAGDLAGVRATARLPGRARRHLPAPDAAAAHRATATTTAATRWSTTTRSTRGSGTMADLEALAADLHAARACRCASTWCSTTPRGAPVGTCRGCRRPGVPRLLPDLPGPDRAGPVRADAARGVPRQGARQLHPRRGRRLGVDDVQHASSGTWTGRTPRCSRRCSPRCCGWPTAVSTCCGWTRRRSCGSGWAPTARTSPRCTCSCRRCGRWSRVARPGVAFKAEAIVAPQQLVQYLGAHERFHPECDLAYHNQLMVLLWSSLATRDVRLARMRWPGCGRHRPRRPGSPTCAATTTSAGPCPTRTRGPAASTRTRTAVPQRLLRRRAPGLVRPRRGVPGQPAHRRPAHLRAARRRCAGSRPRSTRATTVQVDGCRRPAAHALQRRLLLRRHPAALHGRRAGAAQRPAAGPTTRRTPATTAGCTGRRWTGRRGTPRTTPARSRAGCSPVSPQMARARAAQLALRAGAQRRAAATSATTGCWPTVRRHPRGAPAARAGRLLRRAGPAAARRGTAAARLPAPGSRSPAPASSSTEHDLLPAGRGPTPGCVRGLTRRLQAAGPWCAARSAGSAR